MAVREVRAVIPTVPKAVYTIGTTLALRDTGSHGRPPKGYSAGRSVDSAKGLIVVESGWVLIELCRTFVARRVASSEQAVNPGIAS